MLGNIYIYIYIDIDMFMLNNGLVLVIMCARFDAFLAKFSGQAVACGHF